MRALESLPKAHLHLHLTGSMRPSTMHELAARHGVTLPADLLEQDPRWWSVRPSRDWSAFQQRYDAAREVVRSAEDVRRIVLEAAEDDVRDGAGWLELQVDPTVYASRLGSFEAVVEASLEGAREAEQHLPVGVRIVVAASWAQPPSVAEALALVAARYAGQGVVGFGLSNDERRGEVADFAGACRTARDAALVVVPHGGFFRGPGHVEACVRLLGAGRIGHGLSAARSAAVMKLLTETGVVLEICPTSYEPFAVVERIADLPLQELLKAGVPIALGSDDPLLFGVGLAGQYELVRTELGFTDAGLATLARFSITGSTAPLPTKTRLLAAVDAWTATPYDPRPLAHPHSYPSGG